MTWFPINVCFSSVTVGYWCLMRRSTVGKPELTLLLRLHDYFNSVKLLQNKVTFLVKIRAKTRVEFMGTPLSVQSGLHLKEKKLGREKNKYTNIVFTINWNPSEIVKNNTSKPRKDIRPTSVQKARTGFLSKGPWWFRIQEKNQGNSCED